ncbi:MAG: diguanylate cyclase [Deltaproteobacteria bacterium]|nr:diguanylate cyclase [Deltaproteobacteria bacterium]
MQPEYPCESIRSEYAVATYIKGMEKKEDLVQKADDALYQAKQGGRNGV